MRKPALILSILVLIIVGLVVARAIISNRISTSGLALGQAQDELVRYKTENVIIKERILALSSLNYVSSAAASTGFVESKTNFAVAPAHAIAVAR